MYLHFMMKQSYANELTSLTCKMFVGIVVVSAAFEGGTFLFWKSVKK